MDRRKADRVDVGRMRTARDRTRWKHDGYKSSYVFNVFTYKPEVASHDYVYVKV